MPLPAIDGVSEIGSGIYRITDPRPLARVADLLQMKFGVPISYEEEILQHSGDMVFASELPANKEAAAKNPEWRGPLVPRLGTLDLSIPSLAVLRQIANPTEFIQQAFDSRRSNKNTGNFKVVNLGEYGVSIVMDGLADSSGQMKSVVPALDTLVSFPEMDRSIVETIALISKAVESQNGKGFGFGGPGGVSYFESTRAKIGANNEPARNVLARALKSPGQPRMSWTLSSISIAGNPARGTIPISGTILIPRNCDVEVTDSTGNQKLQPLYWPR
jgi:hypothetical protein